jgi:hypothetical protein
MTPDHPDRIRSTLAIRNNRFNPADNPVSEPDFDPMRMERRAGQDLHDDSTGLFPASLVLFPDNIDGQTAADGGPVPPVTCVSDYEPLYHSFPARIRVSTVPISRTILVHCCRTDVGFSWSVFFVVSLLYRLTFHSIMGVITNDR